MKLKVTQYMNMAYGIKRELKWLILINPKHELKVKNYREPLIKN